MNRQEAETFLTTHRQAVLATIRADGRPQTSNVLALFQGGKILVSITETRAKYHNMVRDPRVSVHFLGDTFWQYLVVDGLASFIRLPEARAALREYYESATGKPHPDWAEYDAAMEAEKRVLLTVSIEGMYPLSR